MNEGTLSELLALYCQAEVARVIDRPRGFVHRLRWGQPLYDDSVIPKLARALRMSEAALREIVKSDRARARTARRKGRIAA